MAGGNESEPRPVGVATGSTRHLEKRNDYSYFYTEAALGSRPYHHPKRAARLWTPVRRRRARLPMIPPARPSLKFAGSLATACAFGLIPACVLTRRMAIARC